MRGRGVLETLETLVFYLAVAAGIGAIVGLWIVGGSR